MQKVLLGFACFLTTGIQALEYQLQFENDQVCAAKAKILPHEEIGLHRDVYPQVVVALQGGTISRLEADGRTVDVEFPTGTAVFRPADPENQLHSSVNRSENPVELMIIQLKTPTETKN